MSLPDSPIDRIVALAGELRSVLTDSAGHVFPNNLASDDTTTVQAALLDVRATLDAFLAQADPDNEITGEQSTE